MQGYCVSINLKILFWSCGIESGTYNFTSHTWQCYKILLFRISFEVRDFGLLGYKSHWLMDGNLTIVLCYHLGVRIWIHLFWTSILLSILSINAKNWFNAGDCHVVKSQTKIIAIFSQLAVLPLSMSPSRVHDGTPINVTPATVLVFPFSFLLLRNND